MPRLYLDTNVFSKLRTNQFPEYQKLNNLLSAYSHAISIFFSVAHIRDKRKDLTDFKFLDFEFMENLVCDNYLDYDPIEKKPGFYIATPLMAFNADRPENPFSAILEFLEHNEDEDELIITLKSTIRNLFSSMPMGIEEDTLKNIPEEQRKILDEFLPANKVNPSMIDLMESMTHFTWNLQTDNASYKELREMVDKGLNNGSVSLNDDVNFNEALKDTVIQKTYFDFIKDASFIKDKDKIPMYDFYQLAYSMLDVLGISKDKLTKKNTLNNIQNDGIHSYYARYCDYYITDDNQTKAKSSALYKMFDEHTQVVSVPEFLELLPNIILQEKEDWPLLKAKFEYDLRNAIRKEPNFQDDKAIYRFEKNFLYLNFFDAILEVVSTNSKTYQIIIFKCETNFLAYPNNYEISQIIRRAIEVFGDDQESKLYYDYKNQSKNDDVHRSWIVDNSIVELKYEELIKRYALVVTFPEL